MTLFDMVLSYISLSCINFVDIVTEINGQQEKVTGDLADGERFFLRQSSRV
jgi:hypothetical protein